MKRRLLLLSIFVGACATGPRQAPNFAVQDGVWTAWKEAESGELAQSRKTLDRTIASTNDARLARLVRALMNNEEARPTAALDDAVSVLERAALRPGPVETMIDDAAMAIVASLLADAADPALEERVLSLSARERS